MSFIFNLFALDKQWNCLCFTAHPLDNGVAKRQQRSQNVGKVKTIPAVFVVSLPPRRKCKRKRRKESRAGKERAEQLDLDCAAAEARENDIVARPGGRADDRGLAESREL